MSATASDGSGPLTRFASNFAGFGFFGRTAAWAEAPPLRWMGPIRYGFAGAAAFCQHSLYGGAAEYLPAQPGGGGDDGGGGGGGAGAAACAAACAAADGCDGAAGGAGGADDAASGPPSFSAQHSATTSLSSAAAASLSAALAAALALQQQQQQQQPPQLPLPSSGWRPLPGPFHVIAAATMACRTDAAPRGIAPAASHRDGLLSLLFVRPCARADYLRHLLRLSNPATLGDHTDMPFVSVVKARAFRFTPDVHPPPASAGGDAPLSTDGRWNVDGELLPPCVGAVTGQVCPGLVSFFAFPSERTE